MKIAAFDQAVEDWAKNLYTSSLAPAVSIKGSRL
jgi:hypothetical protein